MCVQKAYSTCSQWSSETLKIGTGALGAWSSLVYYLDFFAEENKLNFKGSRVSTGWHLRYALTCGLDSNKLDYGRSSPPGSYKPARCCHL